MPRDPDHPAARTSGPCPEDSGLVVDPRLVVVPSSFSYVLSWAVFLATSWTWCIGMFLPVLMVRDLGLAGWLIFAIPNVIGAAAMGWVLGSRTDASSRGVIKRNGLDAGAAAVRDLLRERETSVQLVARHRAACAAFSLVTIAFHVFFAGWMIRRILGDWGPSAVVGLVLALWVLGRRTPGRDILAAWVVFFLSLTALMIVLTQNPTLPVHPFVVPGQAPSLIALSLVCIFGFALCPYLDLTFHRARQATEAADARIAFSLGFGLFFLIMIVFTLVYARALAPMLDWPNVPPLPRILALAIGLHMVIQSALTIVLHLRSLLPDFRRVGLVYNIPAGEPSTLRNPPGTLAFLTAAGAIFLLPILLSAIAQIPLRLFSLDGGEVLYRCFMGFYGLIFPTYVYLFMLPFRSSPTPTRSQLILYAIIVLLALPFFFMGFIQRDLVMLIPGMIVVLMARPLRGIMP